MKIRKDFYGLWIEFKTSLGKFCDKSFDIVYIALVFFNKFPKFGIFCLYFKTSKNDLILVGTMFALFQEHPVSDLYYDVYITGDNIRNNHKMLRQYSRRAFNILF